MSRIVVVSKSLGENWCRYNGIPKSKVQVIPYGTDVEALQEPDRVSISRFRESMGIQPSDFVFGSVGRLVEQKDYPNQIDAFALAVKQMSNLRMVLAGDGPLRADLEAYVRRLNLTQSVRFLGHCDSVPLFLRSVDSFVLASKFEPFGVVIIEAKAAGLPIIATDVNSVRDMLSAGHSGLIVPPGDPTRLAEAMLRVAKYPELRESLGKEALMEVRSQNSLQVAINNYQQLYDAARGVHGRPQF
jgi:glycosyltransferase involved in cell wall biosynthesis